MRIRAEWDASKARQNVAAHNVAFEEAILIFEGLMIEAADTRWNYDEDRFIAIGVAAGIELVVVYATAEADVIRLISARRATKRERKAYWESISGKR